MWGTLDDLKGKLGLPATDTSRDDALTLVLEGATSKVASLTRFSEADITGQADTFQNVQEDTSLILKRRPVTGTPVVEGRYLSSAAAWSTLSFDLIDEAKGEILLLGRDAWWPPTLILRPKYMQWRNIEWPIVRVTYDVTGQGTGDAAPQDLQDAVVALARYWYERDLAGAATAEQVGVLQKEYSVEPVPAWVLSRLSQYRDGRGVEWV